MSIQERYTHPSDQLLIQKEPVLKPATRAQNIAYGIYAILAYLVVCIIMWYIATSPLIDLSNTNYRANMPSVSAPEQ